MARSTSLSFAVTTLLLAGTILVSTLTARRVPDPLAVSLTQLAPRIEGWTAVRDQTLEAPTLRALDPTSYLSRDYEKDGRHLDLFIAFYAQQRAGESMHSPKHCLPGSGWEIWKHDSASIPTHGKWTAINKYSIQYQGVRRLMFYWYQSKSRIIASEYLGKFYLAKDAILTGHTAGSIVRITLPDVPGASEEGISFATRLVVEVERCLGAPDPTTTR